MLRGRAKMAEPLKRNSEDTETSELIAHALRLANRLAIKRVLVQAEESVDVGILKKARKTEEILWLMKGTDQAPLQCEGDWSQEVTIPDAALPRMEQVKLSLLLVYLEELVAYDETVMALSGSVGSGRLDTLVILNIERDYPWFRECKALASEGIIPARVIYRIIAVALKFAAEGREGRPVGTTFLVGRHDGMKAHLRQLMLNPCEGHPSAERNVLHPGFLETWRELAALDGAIIIDADGTVTSAGTYLSAEHQDIEVQEGLGARHVAAASLTASCPDALAVVISESSGRVRVFRRGKVVTELQPTVGGF
jgi:DNA integrity scanning protein DisA with diadenylate cyclase activity